MQKSSFAKNSIFIFFVGFNLFQLHAQKQISLSQALELAQKNNDEIKRQEIILAASERACRYSYNSLLPSMSISASETISSDAIEKKKEAGVSGNVSLSFKSDVFYESSKKRTDYEFEKQNYLQLCNQVKTSVINSYLEIIILQMEVLVRKKMFENSKSLFEENLHKYKKGFLSENEYIVSKINYEKQKLELKNRQKEIGKQISQFKILLGINDETEMEFSSNLNNLISNMKVEQENVEFPSIHLLKLKKKSAENELKAKKINAWSPSFDLSYSAGQTFDERKNNTSLSFGMTFYLDSLLPFSKQKEEVRLAEDAVKDYEIQIQSEQKSLDVRFNELVSEFNDKKESTDAYGSFVALAERNYNSSLKLYNSGVIDFQSLKNASSEYLELQIEYSSCVAEIIRIFVEVQKISGKEISFN